MASVNGAHHSSDELMSESEAVVPEQCLLPSQKSIMAGFLLFN